MFNPLVIILFFLLKLNALYVPFSRVKSKRSPHRIDLLGRSLVLWWDKIKWRAASDICPHRQGSFSDGVITPKGDIKCGYHGWEFNGCGKCVHMPALEKVSPVKIPTFDVIEKQGLLWLTDNKNHSIDSIENLSKNNVFTEWFIQDVDTRHDLFIENAMDLLHFNHVHHGIPPFITDRYKEMKAAKKEDIMVDWYNETGFSINMGHAVQFTFYPPYTIHFDLKKFSIWASMVPLEENKTRFVSNLLIPFKTQLQRKFIEFFYFIFKPLGQIVGFEIYRQDKKQLQRQAENIKVLGRKKYMYNYVVDKPIELYNKWINEFGNTTTLL